GTPSGPGPRIAVADGAQREVRLLGADPDGGFGSWRFESSRPVQSVGSEDVAQRTAKAWDDVLAVQLLLRSHGRHGSVRAVDPRMVPAGIEHPDEPDARVEPLTHLLQHLTRPVAR